MTKTPPHRDKKTKLQCMVELNEHLFQIRKKLNHEKIEDELMNIKV